MLEIGLTFQYGSVQYAQTTDHLIGTSSLAPQRLLVIYTEMGTVAPARLKQILIHSPFSRQVFLSTKQTNRADDNKSGKKKAQQQKRNKKEAEGKQLGSTRAFAGCPLGLTSALTQ
ncbi:hypothetical protein TNCV_3645231 [Trichonephila clavipes]|nr:hypothetical protein TNCV_3645231 [Trichonephila clavipes]